MLLMISGVTLQSVLPVTLKEAFALSDSREILWLLEKATGLTSTQLRLTDVNTPLTAESENVLLHMIKQRHKHIPLQYVLGCWEFMGLPIECRPGVLIPRRDTEILAAEAIRFLKNCPESPVVLDLCTGSGCVGISMAYFCPEARVISSDINMNAIKLAKENAVNNGVGDRISFIQSDLFEKINGQFHCITANPPYIPTKEIAGLSNEVRQEPILALDGGIDGLDFYRAIIPVCGKYLLPEGEIFLEIGSTQGKQVAAMLQTHGFKDVAVIKDMESRDRVVRGKIIERIYSCLTD